MQGVRAGRAKRRRSALLLVLHTRLSEDLQQLLPPPACHKTSTPLPCPTAKQHTERVEGSRRAAVARLGALCDPPSGAAHHAVQVRCCTLRAPRALRRVRRMRARSALMLPLACWHTACATWRSCLDCSAALLHTSRACAVRSAKKMLPSPPKRTTHKPKNTNNQAPQGLRPAAGDERAAGAPAADGAAVRRRRRSIAAAGGGGAARSRSRGALCCRGKPRRCTLVAPAAQ